MSGPAIHVPHRASNSYRETSPPRSASHEAHSVAPQKQLECTRITTEGDNSAQITPPPLTVVTGGKQCAPRSTIAPTKTCNANVYRCINRGLGCSPERAHCKGNLVPSREQSTYQLSGTKGSFSGSETVPGPLLEHHISHIYRQHNGGCLYKQRRGDEFGPSVWPAVENPNLVHHERGDPQSLTHPRSAKCDSRQVIQAGPDHSNRMVPSPRGLPGSMQPVASAPGGPICHQVQPQTAQIYLTGPRHTGPSSGWPKSVLGKSGPICLSTSHHLGQSGGEVPGLPVQMNNSDRPRVAQHALVLGPGGSVQSDPTVPAKSAQFTDSAIQPDTSQKSGKPESSCLAPGASAIKEQDFSEQWQHELRLLKEDQPDQSMRQSRPFLKSGVSVHHLISPLLTSCCTCFRAGNYNPALLMAIDQPLLTNWATLPSMSAKMKISPVSWIASTEIGPKGGGAYPPGTFPWCCTSSLSPPLIP